MNLQDLSPAEFDQWFAKATPLERRQFFEAEKQALEVPPQLTPLAKQAEQALEDEILAATTSSRFPKLQLAQIAKCHGTPLEIVEQIASVIFQRRTGQDPEEAEFNAVISQVKKLEEIQDAGLREWKLQALARKFKRSPSQMMAAYNKALCQQAPVVPLTVAEFRAMHTQEMQWLFPGWAPAASTILLHGDGGAGKTLFLYEMMECILKGKPWNGYPVEKGHVLLVQTDEPSVVTNERIDIRGIDENDPLHILPDWQVEAMPRLASYLEVHRPKMVIIDSLSSINRNCIFSENDMEYARPLLQLRDLANQYGCTFFIIHHSNFLGQARGTRAIHNSVSEVWSLKSNADTPQERLLRVEKTRMGRPPGKYRFQFDEESFSFHYLGEGENDDQNSESSTQEHRVRLWMFDSDHQNIPYTATEVAEYIGLAKHSARRALYELWCKGIIHRRRSSVGRGHVYFATSSNVTSDQSDQSDQPSDHFEVINLKPQPVSDRPPSDQVITENPKISLLKSKNERSLDHFELQPASLQENEVITPSDQQVITSPVIDNDHFTDHLSDRTTEPDGHLTNVEAYVNEEWHPGRYIKPLNTLRLSHLNRTLEPSHRIDVFKPDGCWAAILTDSEFRWVEPCQ